MITTSYVEERSPVVVAGRTEKLATVDAFTVGLWLPRYLAEPATREAERWQRHVIDRTSRQVRDQSTDGLQARLP